LCGRAGWPDNASFEKLLAWTWQSGRERYLIAVNWSEQPLQAKVSPGWPDIDGGTWLLADAFSGERYERDGNELAGSGLCVELGPWGFHFFSCSRQ